MNRMKPENAIVRRPSNYFTKAVSQHPLKNEIDIGRARDQHRIFCETLQKLDINLIKLSPADRYPDSVFVEDTAVVINNKVIICRFAIQSRRGEEKEIENKLSTFNGLDIYKIKSPGTIEGGDILKTENKIFIGISHRTNLVAIEQFQKYVGNIDIELTIIKKGVLHLKSMCTYLGRNIMLVNKQGVHDLTSFSNFKIIPVPSREEINAFGNIIRLSTAANCLSIGNTVLASKSFPYTSNKIRRQGFNVIELDISEFEKADGAMTCLAVLF